MNINTRPIDPLEAHERVNALKLEGPLETIPEILLRAAKLAPDHVALVFEDERSTYREYLGRAKALAHHLSNTYHVEGQRVATVLGNTDDTCVAFFAVWMAGAQLVPLNPLYTAPELETILADAAPELIITDQRIMVADAHSFSRITDAPVVEIEALVSQGVSEAGGDAQLPHVHPADLALLQYTGGTSGVPKGVELTHQAVGANVWQRELRIPMNPGHERVLCVMPLFHSYAMAMGLFLAAYSHSTLVIMGKYRPDDLLEKMDQHRITAFPGNPTIYTGLLAFDGFSNRAWPNLKVCFSGSAALPAAVLSEWEACTGAPILEGYGQTEAGPILTFASSSEALPAGSVGKPVHDTQIRIVDLESGTTTLPMGQLGEVTARGPQIMSGYLNKPTETGQSLRNGWLFTGDIGELDADGNLFIRDRKKEMVISGGYNIYPREIEEVLMAHPLVTEVAVVGVHDAYRGEILRAYLVAREDLDEKQLREYCSSRLAKYKIPAQFHLLTDLPKTTVNKIDKKQLREAAQHEVQ